MSQFNTSKNKLQKLWEQTVANINKKKAKDNKDDAKFFQKLSKQQILKVPLEIFNSGTISAKPVVGGFTAYKNENMPAEVSYTQNIKLEIPEDFLPFVKYSTEITTVPGTESHVVYEYDPSTWTGDVMEVRGDGILIYKGQPLIQAINFFFITFAESTLNERGISLGLTKETWLVELESDIRGIRTGKIMTVGATKIDSVGSCLSNDNTTVFGIQHFANKNHKIISLDENGFTGIGNETITTYTSDGEGGCDANVVVNENVTRIISFSDMDDFQFQLAEFSNIGLIYSKSEIIDLEITKEDRWLFYSIELQKIFSTVITDTVDGDFSEIQLNNLPDTNNGDILPYTNITVKRNFDGINPEPTQLKQSSGQLITGVGNQRPSSSVLTSLVKTGKEYENYLKISNAIIPGYRFKLSGNFYIVAPSTRKNLKSITNPDTNDLNFKVLTMDDRGVSNSGSNWQLHFEQSGDDLVGLVDNIEHTVVSGLITTDFKTEPGLISSHSIIDLTSVGFTAIGNETITNLTSGEPIITAQSNVTRSLTFASSSFSILVNDTINFPVYDDIYTVSGSSYNLTTENHSMYAKQIWTPETQDVTYNIKAHLVNPLYWTEQREYKHGI